jgi:hypothetical protein
MSKMTRKRKVDAKPRPEMPTAHHRPASRNGFRYIAVIVTLVAAIVSATLVTYASAVVFRPARFVSIARIGRIEVLRMPIGARRLIDIKSFVITMRGADDYGRVYVNNYLVLNKEAPEIFYTGRDDPQKRNAIAAKKAQRNVNIVGDNDVKGYLLVGSNIIVAELENAVGPCTFGLDSMLAEHNWNRFPELFLTDLKPTATL